MVSPLNYITYDFLLPGHQYTFTPVFNLL